MLYRGREHLLAFGAGCKRPGHWHPAITEHRSVKRRKRFRATTHKNDRSVRLFKRKSATTRCGGYTDVSGGLDGATSMSNGFHRGHPFCYLNSCSRSVFGSREFGRATLSTQPRPG